jgi:hypothetical protein
MSDKTQPSQFHIAFDTNLLFVEAENKLIKDSLSEFILEMNEIPSPTVSWHLLDIVRAERHYQMLQVALKLVVHANKVGKLLGKDFGITKNGLEQGIDSVIAEQVRRHNLTISPLDATLVDWAALIKRSTSRDAPFDEGKVEKSFRDSIVLETFIQLVEHVSRSKARRFVLMTNDRRLKEAVIERMQGRDDVSTVDDVPTLKSMLNAYASHIDRLELEELLQKAHQLFYREDDGESLFYKWNIEQNIKDHLSALLLQPPPGWAVTAYVTAIVSSVGPTTFVKKIDRQITFATYLDFFVFAALPLSSGQSYGAEPYRSTANTTYPGLITGSLYPGATGPIGASGSLYPGTGTSAIGATGLLGASGFIPGSGATITSDGRLFPSAGTSAVGTSSLYPGLGTLNIGATGPTPRFVYQRGRKVFEIQWEAKLATDQLRDPRQVKTGLLSSEWQQS